MAKFVKGQSGNPGGGPSDGSLREAARVHTEEAISTLVAVMKSKKSPAASRVAAACALLDRGYGKPMQAIEATGKDGEPLIPEASPMELARSFAFLVNQVNQVNQAHKGET